MSSKLLGDRLFALIVAILVVGGTSVFLSAALGLLARENSLIGHIAVTQMLLGLVPGLIVLVFLRFCPPAWIEKGVLPFYILAVIATALVFVPGIGHHANGASRWLAIGPLTVQPAEFLKLATILMLSLYLAKIRTHISDLKHGLLGFGVIIGVPALLLLAQPNTSTTMVIGLTAGALYFIAGAPMRDFAILLCVAVIGAGALVATRPYLMHRVQTFIHPENNALSTGYQIQQSLIAIGSGGLLGRGFGQSVQKFNYLPEPIGDSVFAVMGEELGLIGILFLFLLYGIVIVRGCIIALRSESHFGRLLAFGISCTLLAQICLNIGSMVGILPLTGVPLPLVSHGGTALLATLFEIGVLLRISRQTNTL